MAKMDFEATVNNRDFRNKIKEMKSDIRGVRDGVKDAGVSIQDTFDKIVRAAGVAFGVSQLVAFGKKVAEVRGEFQQLEVAFATMLQSKEKADRLMAQAIEFAATTPFDVQSVASGTKQLLAYGSTAEDVMEEMKMLGNIASGLSIPLNDIVYLFGTTRTQGRMYTQDLRQFMGRGIPLAEELAKQFGVAKDEVGKLVTDGKVGFEEMNKALQSMTSEGGKFFNLMGEQSKTIAGQVSNLGDSIQQMFNEMGQRSEGFIAGLLNGASWAVENYERLGRVLIAAVTAWGAYKAAVIAVAAAHKVAGFVENIRLIGMFRKELGLATAAQQAFNTASKANIYVAIASAILTVVSSLVAFRKEIFGAGKDMKALSDATDAYNKAVASEGAKIDDMFAKLNAAKKGTAEYKAAKDAIMSQYGDYLKNLDKEISALDDVAGAYDAIKKAAEDSAKARALEAGTADAYTEYGDTMAKVLKNVKSELDKFYGDAKDPNGGRRADVIYYRLQPVLQGREKMTEDLQNIVNSVVDTYAAGTDGAQAQTNMLKEYIGQADRANTLLQSTVRTMQDVFGGSRSMMNGPEKPVGLGAVQEAAMPELTDEQKKEAERRMKVRKQNAEEEAQEARKSAEELEDIMRLGERAAQDARIAEMVGGAERYKAQADAVNMRAKEDAKIEFDRTVADEIERQRDAYEKMKGTDKGFAANMDNDVIRNARKVYDERVKIADSAHKRELAEYERRSAEAMDEYLIAYGDYQQQKEAIARKYAASIAKAETEGEKMSLEAERDRTIRDLDRSYADEYKVIFADVARQSVPQLRRALALAEKELEKMRDDATVTREEYMQMVEQVNSLRDAIEEVRYNFGKVMDVGEFSTGLMKLMDLKRRIEKPNYSNSNWMAQQLKDIAEMNRLKEDFGRNIVPTGLNVLIQGLQKAAECMEQIAEASGNTELSDVAGKLSAISQNFGAAAQGAQSGGWIGAIIGGVADLLSQTTDAILSSQIALEMAKVSASDFAQKLEMIKLKVGDYDSIFGTQKIRLAADAYGKMNLAADEYNKTLESSWEKWQKVEGEVSFWLVFQRYRALERGLNGLQRLSVNITQYSGIAKLFKNDIFQSLYDYAPQLWEDGIFNVENAKAFLETDKLIDESIRKAIQSAIDLQEAYEEAMDTVDSVASEFFGNLATDLTDALWDGIVNGGEDAWSKWQDIGAEAVASIGKEMMKEMLMKTWIEQYQERIRAAFGSDNTGMELSRIVGEMVQGFPTLFDSLTATAQTYKAEMEALGIDFSGSGSRSASAAAGITATQESVDKQSAILTSIQGIGYNIEERVSEIAGRIGGSAEYERTITALLTDIRSDTRRLSAIESSLGALAADVADITARGVRITN